MDSFYALFNYFFKIKNRIIDIVQIIEKAVLNISNSEFTTFLPIFDIINIINSIDKKISCGTIDSFLLFHFILKILKLTKSTDKMHTIFFIYIAIVL